MRGFSFAVGAGDVFSASSFFLELRQDLFDLFFGEGFAALGALKQLVGQLVINKIIREVNPIESYGEAVDAGEVFVLTSVT